MARLVARALEPAPERRFQSAAEFLTAAEAALAELAPRRPRAWLMLAAAGALALAAAGAVAGLRHRRERAPALQITSTQVIDNAARCGSDPYSRPTGTPWSTPASSTAIWSCCGRPGVARAATPDPRQRLGLRAHHLARRAKRGVSPHRQDHRAARAVARRRRRQHPPLSLGPTFARPAWSARGGVLASSADGNALDEWDLRASPPASLFIARLPGTAVMEGFAAYDDGVVVANWHLLSEDYGYTLGELREGAPVRILAGEAGADDGAGRRSLAVGLLFRRRWRRRRPSCAG